VLIGRRYIRLKTMICLIVGLLVGLSYWAAAVPFPWLFAAFSFFLNYIPNVRLAFAVLSPSSFFVRG
jgi:predicted PurR-regulated permease PerM